MNDLWNTIETAIQDYAPQVLAAIVILAVGWLVAALVSWVVRRLLHRVGLDERIARSVGGDGGTSTATSIASATFWIIMLLAVVAALEALAFEVVTEPLSNVVSTLLGFVPHLIAAVAILFIGYVIARVLQGVGENVTSAVGIDRLGERAGITQGDGGTPRLSQTIGLIIFALILIPAIVAALNALQIDAVAEPTSAMLTTMLGAVPSIFAATVLLVIAYLVARIVAQLVAGILAGLGLDALPGRLGMNPNQAQVAGRTPSQVAAGILFAVIMLLASLEAAQLLGFAALATLISAFLVYVGQVLVGLLIIGIGIWVANLVTAAIRASNVPRAALMATIGRLAIIVLAVAIGLGEMGIAEGIVLIAFGLPLAALAIGLAIGLGVAMGLGGRGVAQEELENVRQAIRSGSDGPPP